ncbi:hypothetical protein DQ384_38055 [Sphaerisporangium album]|uniref:Uncharacterized protein n=1 Tax=Sphaerisporangium album TaxID=509200 RepID=A0A367ENV2_9ACTN|nr:hypothetical protein [Sphaerisporangium album]RCG19087.1 hypothetical protein DQ384_38055 [Sphaerisporangium album]
MGARPKTYRHRQTQVIVRLAGPHQATTEVSPNGVRVNIPGAVITIGDTKASRSIVSLWRDAAESWRRLFPTDLRAPSYPITTGSTTWVSVALTGRISGRDVQGKAPKFSRSHCGELRVRMGELVIVMDDQAAARSQIPVWLEACELMEIFFQ